MNTITIKDGTQIYFKDWGKGQPIIFCLARTRLPLQELLSCFSVTHSRASGLYWEG